MSSEQLQRLNLLDTEGRPDAFKGPSEKVA
jgi:hypothetical protein